MDRLNLRTSCIWSGSIASCESNAIRTISSFALACFALGANHAMFYSIFQSIVTDFKDNKASFGQNTFLRSVCLPLLIV